MAPSSSKLLPEQCPLGVCKRILAANLASLDNIDPGAVKCHKLEEAAVAHWRERQPSIKDLNSNSDDSSISLNTPPLNPLCILEAADGSDDGDNSDGEHEMPQLEKVDDSNDEDPDLDNKEEESDEMELLCLSEDWTLPIYAFFGAVPDITYINGCKVHEFRCSTKALRARVDIEEAHAIIGGLRDSSITAAFE
ncbi:hypothetical protein BYT27DRAFT_7218535 [Phlegmacium glaucopus]|nr:hypothetical protein BYT27DRAFT_7218535 [Phlegmacium glaucopus]